MKRKYIIGYGWIIFGIVSLISVAIKGYNFYSSSIDYSEGLFKKMPHAIDLLKSVQSYYTVIILFYFMLNFAVVYIGFSYIKEKSWAIHAVINLSRLYILLLSIFIAFVFVLFQKLSLDLDISFWESGVIKNISKLSLLFIPFLLSIYFTKKVSVHYK